MSKFNSIWFCICIGKATFGEQEWYFFSPRDRKYPNGARPNRAATSGYWKATGTDKPILTSIGNQKVGVKKALVFYGGKPPKGIKSNWIMHEYRLVNNNNNFSKPPDASNKKASLRVHLILFGLSNNNSCVNLWVLIYCFSSCSLMIGFCVGFIRKTMRRGLWWTRILPTIQWTVCLPTRHQYCQLRHRHRRSQSTLQTTRRCSKTMITRVFSRVYYRQMINKALTLIIIISIISIISIIMISLVVYLLQAQKVTCPWNVHFHRRFGTMRDRWGLLLLLLLQVHRAKGFMLISTVVLAPLLQVGLMKATPPLFLC